MALPDRLSPLFLYCHYLALHAYLLIKYPSVCLQHCTDLALPVYEALSWGLQGMSSLPPSHLLASQELFSFPFFRKRIETATHCPLSTFPSQVQSCSCTASKPMTMVFSGLGCTSVAMGSISVGVAFVLVILLF